MGNAPVEPQKRPLALPAPPELQLAVAHRRRRPAGVRWVPTSSTHVAAAEEELLTLVRTGYIQERVDIGACPMRRRSRRMQARFINTISFDSSGSLPTIVLLHGYAASLGFYFRNFDFLSDHFAVIAIDQLGCGASSRPNFTCKSTEETEAWFVDSLEQWRAAKKLDRFVLLGHSFGGYIASKYALKHPERIQHLILVGPAGFPAEPDAGSNMYQKFSARWQGAFMNILWEANFTPQRLVRGLGPCGRFVVHNYTSTRFGTEAEGVRLTDHEEKLFTEYVYHTVAAKPSGEFCLKYIFTFGAFARRPLLPHAPEWKVPTTFIYGWDDWMSYRGAQRFRDRMKVPCEVIRIPQAGHFAFIDNPAAFHAAVLHACRHLLPAGDGDQPLPEGLVAE